MASLHQLNDVLGLDYLGVDFSLDQKGEMLLFEANATMRVFPPAPDEKWAFRREPVHRIMEAIRALIIKRAAQYNPGI